MAHIPLFSNIHSGLSAIVDDENFELLSSYRWYAFKTKTNYYAVRNEKSNGKVNKILMHRQILGCNSSDVVDHIDHNGLNNTLQNIRVCSIAENNKNRNKVKQTSSKYLGVTKYVSGKRVRISAVISVNSKNIKIGDFKTEEEAALAYNNAAKKYHGEFANLNKLPI